VGDVVDALGTDASKAMVDEGCAEQNVIVAGLGLGWLLQRIAARAKVKRITLVERSQELIDWVMPRLDLNGRQIKIVCGDARKLIPKAYGGNTFPRCPNIPYVWVWGNQYVT